MRNGGKCSKHTQAVWLTYLPTSTPAPFTPAAAAHPNPNPHSPIHHPHQQTKASINP